MLTIILHLFGSLCCLIRWIFITFPSVLKRYQLLYILMAYFVTLLISHLVCTDSDNVSPTTTVWDGPQVIHLNNESTSCNLRHSLLNQIYCKTLLLIKMQFVSLVSVTKEQQHFFFVIRNLLISSFNFSQQFCFGTECSVLSQRAFHMDNFGSFGYKT